MIKRGNINVDNKEEGTCNKQQSTNEMINNTHWDIGIGGFCYCMEGEDDKWIG